MNLTKKADMGIGTLIIFIAMILVAAITAGVLLQTASSLQSKALLTGERTKTEVATSAHVILLYAENGADANLTYFCQKMTLSPGSDAISFTDALIEFDTKDSSSDKIYGWSPDYLDNTTELLAIDNSIADFNADSLTDYLNLTGVANASDNLSIVISGVGEWNYTFTPAINGSVNTSNPYKFYVFDEPVTIGGTTYGSMSIVGQTRTPGNITDDAHIFLSTGTSGYAVEYLIRGPNYKGGFLQRGDVVKVCYSSPRIISTDEDISVRFVPKVGHVTLIETATPDILNDKREYIFP